MKANKGFWLFIGTLVVEVATKLLDHVINERRDEE